MKMLEAQRNSLQRNGRDGREAKEGKGGVWEEVQKLKR